MTRYERTSTRFGRTSLAAVVYVARACVAREAFRELDRQIATHVTCNKRRTNNAIFVFYNGH